MAFSFHNRKTNGDYSETPVEQASHVNATVKESYQLTQYLATQQSHERVALGLSGELVNIADTLRHWEERTESLSKL